jgi:hypothetical protein
MIPKIAEIQVALHFRCALEIVVSRQSGNIIVSTLFQGFAPFLYLLVILIIPDQYITI